MASEKTVCTVDEASALVQNFLSSLKVEKSTAVRVRLSVEETLLRWFNHFEEAPEFHLEMGMRWSRPFIVLKLWEEKFDPLTESRNDLGLWVGDLLGTIGLAPVYRYINGCNIVQFPLRRPQWNPGITLMVFTLAGSLLGIWKPALLITFFSVLALILRMLHVSLLYQVPVTRLWSKMKKSFLLSLKTFSVEASYTDNVWCCEKELGISKKLTSYSIPIGLICFMPVSTVASTILTIVLAGDILMGFVIYPVNQAMLQLDLVLTADKQGLLRKETLRK